MFKGVLPFMYPYWQSYYSPIITLMYSLIHLYVITELVKREFFKGYMRSLWEQHVAWTRLAIISIVLIYLT